MKPLPMDQQRAVSAPANDGSRPLRLRHDEKENVTPFKRRRGNVKRLRRSPLRKFFRPFFLALMIVGLPAAVLAWPLISPRFAFQTLTVETGDRVSEEWVRQTLQPLVGTNLLLLSLPRTESLLRQHPWVENCALRKDLPSRLVVRITEKRAVALLSSDKKLYYLAANGAPIAPFDPLAGKSDLMLISRPESPASKSPAPPSDGPPSDGLRSNGLRSNGSRSDGAPSNGPTSSLRSAIQLADEITELDPPWRAGLSEIVILGEKDFQIFTTSLPFSLLVRVGTLKEKVRRLEELLPQIVDHYDHAGAIDLRFARRIIVQPSVDTGSITTDRNRRRQI